MKPFILLLGIAPILFFGCTGNNTKNLDDSVIHRYYAAVEQNDFNAMKQFLHDSVATYEGKMLISKGVKDFYRIYQWDSVFQPTYRIVEANESDPDTYVVKISKDCRRIRFLMDEPFLTSQKISTDGEKILRIETIDYLNADWDKWESRRNALVGYTDTHHPELSGFVFDQSREGAVHYLQAIEHYTNRD